LEDYEEGFSEHYESNPGPYIYEKEVVGSIDYVGLPGLSFFDTDVDSYNNMYENMMADIDRISQENYEIIASEFDVDLSEYRYIKPTDEEYKSLDLFLLRLQFESNVGDLVPRIYLDKSNKSGIILKRDC
jgi:hypothetical protein